MLGLEVSSEHGVPEKRRGIRDRASSTFYLENFQALNKAE